MELLSFPLHCMVYDFYLFSLNLLNKIKKIKMDGLVELSLDDMSKKMRAAYLSTSLSQK